MSDSVTKVLGIEWEVLQCIGSSPIFSDWFRRRLTTVWKGIRCRYTKWHDSTCHNNSNKKRIHLQLLNPSFARVLLVIGTQTQRDVLPVKPFAYGRQGHSLPKLRRSRPLAPVGTARGSASRVLMTSFGGSNLRDVKQHFGAVLTHPISSSYLVS